MPQSGLRCREENELLAVTAECGGIVLRNTISGKGAKETRHDQIWEEEKATQQGGQQKVLFLSRFFSYLHCSSLPSPWRSQLSCCSASPWPGWLLYSDGRHKQCQLCNVHGSNAGTTHHTFISVKSASFLGLCPSDVKVCCCAPRISPNFISSGASACAEVNTEVFDKYAKNPAEQFSLLSL